MMDMAAFGVWQAVVVVAILALLLALLRLLVFSFDFWTSALVLEASCYTYLRSTMAAQMPFFYEYIRKG